MAKASLISRIKANAAGRAKSSVSTLALVLESIDHLHASGDWTPLAWMVGLSEGNDVTRLRAIIKAACGVSMVADEKQPSGYRAKMPKPEEAATEGANDTPMSTLAALVGYGVGFRSKMLETGVQDGQIIIPALLPKAEKEYDIAALGRAVLKAKDEGYDDKAIMAYVKTILADAGKVAA